MTTHVSRRRLLPAVIGVIVFAALITLRYEVESVLARATLGLLACGALAWGIWKTLSR